MMLVLAFHMVRSLVYIVLMLVMTDNVIPMLVLRVNLALMPVMIDKLVKERVRSTTPPKLLPSLLMLPSRFLQPSGDWQPCTVINEKEETINPSATKAKPKLSKPPDASRPSGFRSFVDFCFCCVMALRLLIWLC